MTEGEKLEMLRICQVSGCGRPIYRAQPWCEKHYSKVRTYGDPLGGKYEHTGRKGDFWSKVDRAQGDNACWEWLGAKNSDGYGQVKVSGRQFGAHVIAYEKLVGPVPDGLELDHLCFHRACVNPAHMEPVTTRENLLRTGGDGPGPKARQTHCKRGHPFDDLNTGHDPRGGRFCRTCKRERSRRVA